MVKISKRNKYESPSYWTQLIQLSIHDNIARYLEEHGLTRAEFAERLGVSKGYVSQILNGDFDHKLSKLTELALACDMVPSVEFVPKSYAAQIVHTYLQPTDWRRYNSYERTVSFDNVYVRSPKFTAISGIGPMKMSSSVKPDDAWTAETKLILQNNKIA